MGEAPPPVGTLGAMLEELPTIRRALLRDNHKHFTKWRNQNSVGVKSVKAMALNAEVLYCVAQFWCPQSTYPRPVQIGFLRDEVGWFKKKQNNTKHLN